MPILLYNDECAICRWLGSWVQHSAKNRSGEQSLIAQPIGEDPKAIRALNPKLDIWDAYANLHVLMPDGTMKTDGEAVAEVLRDLPKTAWFAWCFSIRLLGFRPFQVILNLFYLILADVRPLLGCESCGAPTFWVRPILKVTKMVKHLFTKKLGQDHMPHASSFTGFVPPAPEKKLA